MTLTGSNIISNMTLLRCRTEHCGSLCLRGANSPEETRRDGTGRDGTGRDGTGRDGTGRDGTGRDGTGRDGTGRDGTGRDGTRRDETRRDETRRDETRRDETRRDETRRDETRRDEMRAVKGILITKLIRAESLHGRRPPDSDVTRCCTRRRNTMITDVNKPTGKHTPTVLTH